MPNVENHEGYNSPEKIRNDNYIYNTPIQKVKHIAISPVKYNKPIYQYKRTEETSPITYRQKRSFNRQSHMNHIISRQNLLLIIQILMLNLI